MNGVACGRLSIEDMIDDMNDGNRFIPSINGRVGAWTAYHDDTPMVSMHPDFNDPFLMEKTGDDCRILAAHVYGGPFTVWGAGFGVGLGNPYNASGYYGIGFWARSAVPLTLQIAFPDKDTAVAGGLCDPGSTGSNGCYDHYSARRPVGPQWQRIEITYGELTQLGFGRRGQGFDPRRSTKSNFDSTRREIRRLGRRRRSSHPQRDLVHLQNRQLAQASSDLRLAVVAGALAEQSAPEG